MTIAFLTAPLCRGLLARRHYRNTTHKPLGVAEQAQTRSTPYKGYWLQFNPSMAPLLSPGFQVLHPALLK
jgi:hypothetical protein